MEEISLQRIRSLIIAIHSVSDDGILSFNIVKAPSLGYSAAEIDTANKILAMERVDHLDNLFKSKILFASVHRRSELSLDVRYIGIAKLIFLINNEKGFYSYTTEEELEADVMEELNFMVDLTYVMANIENDAYGNQI